ncbi:carboxypeptidase-like regulatory domain-containing protein, partial [Clostridium tarantellae]
MQIKKDIYNSIQSEKVYVKGVGSDIKLDLQLDFNNKEPNIESSISGKVVDENNIPIEGAIVKLMDQKLQPLTNTTTNSNGNYSFNFFPYSNIYNLMSIASGKLISQVAPFSLSKGENLNFDFKLKTDIDSNFATLSGNVLDTNSKGISGAIALLYSMINGVNTLIAITHTDVAGIFVFNELTPGDYSITITALGYIQGNSTVNIKSGIITRFSKILYGDAKAENGIISGIITDSLNNVISEAKVILYKVESDNELTPISVTKTNNKGIYTFINVPTGIYFIKSNQSELVTVNEENTINSITSITSITSASSKNLALNKQAVSSSNETDYFTANLVTDGNNESASSRWSSGAFI